MSIITKGYGKNSRIITLGFGKWKKVVSNKPHFLQCCPNCGACGSLFKNNLYYTRDIITNEKIFRCGHCYASIKWNGSQWLLANRDMW